jgi:hypothetical protein
MAKGRYSPLAEAKARFSRAANASAKANPDDQLTSKFDGFWDHLQTVSTSEAAAERDQAAQKALAERDARIRRAMQKEEH